MNDTTPAPTAAQQWLAELQAVLGDIKHGLVRRLEALTQSVPADATCFAALRLIANSTATPAPMPAGTLVRGFIASAVNDQATAVGSAAATLLAHIGKHADVLLDQRTNDPDGVIVRCADFARCYRLLSPANVANFVVAEVRDPLPDGHPAAGIAPFLIPGGMHYLADLVGTDSARVQLPPSTPLIVLGRFPTRWFWRTQVERLTNGWSIAIRASLAEMRREDELRAAAAKKQFEASPQGQRQRIERLERELAEQKKNA